MVSRVPLDVAQVGIRGRNGTCEILLDNGVDDHVERSPSVRRDITEGDDDHQCQQEDEADHVEDPFPSGIDPSAS